MGENILTVQNLKVYYHSANRIVPAVDGVDLTLAPGEMLGIVGESGCGKSTAARALIGLYDKSYTQIAGGKALFAGMDLLKLPVHALNRIRGKRISMIFQNPLTSLNPVYTIENQISEIIRLHEKLGRTAIHARCLELMKLVGIPAPEERLKDYPHQLSGGMQQRVLIAIALACNPDIVIADEPTTALDVTIQAQILNLIRDINRKMGMAMILISHNMGIIAEMCDRIMVMYGGVTVEEGDVVSLFRTPMHPYTRGLLMAIPSIEEEREALFTIEGTVPRFSLPVTGCRFAERCKQAMDICRREAPQMISLADGRNIRCHLYSNVINLRMQPP